MYCVHVAWHLLSPLLIMHFRVSILWEYIQYCILVMSTLIVCVCSGDLHLTFSHIPLQESSYCFWPEGSGSAGVDGAEEVYGKLTITMKRLSSYGDITERRLEVVESEGTSPHRIVTLLQLSSWPLEEVPHPSAILSLVDLLSIAQRTSPSRHIIVMCRYT